MWRHRSVSHCSISIFLEWPQEPCAITDNVGTGLQAAWVAGQYADITFTDQRNFTSALHRVVSALTDPELPVRVDSVVALRAFVEACKGGSFIPLPLLSMLYEDSQISYGVELVWIWQLRCQVAG